MQAFPPVPCECGRFSAVIPAALHRGAHKIARNVYPDLTQSGDMLMSRVGRCPVLIQLIMTGVISSSAMKH